VGPRKPSLFYKVLQFLGLYLYALMIEGVLRFIFLIFESLQETCGVDCAAPITLGLGMVPVSLGVMCVSIVLKWLLLGKSQAGKRELSWWFSIRYWLVDTMLLSSLMQIASALLDPAIGLPAFLRALGTKVGKRCFIGGGYMFRASADLVTIADDVISGSSLVCDPSQCHVEEAGTIDFKPIRIGSTSQFGNGVVLNSGVELATKTTIGTMSCIFANTKILEVDSTWAGAPIQLYKVGREDDEVQTQLLQNVSWGAESHEYQGGVKRTCLGIASSFVATIMDTLVWSGLVTLLTLAINYTFSHYQLKGYVAKAAAGVVVVLLTFFFAMLIVVIVKRFLIPRFLGRYPLWSRAFITWQALSIVMGTLGGTILPYIQGTAFMALWLRALGAKVGTNLYMDTSGPVETDCLEIGDNCVVMPTMQAMVPHTMDRGMIQWSPIKFGNSCSTGFNSCIMLMADVRDGASVGPLSVVLKAELIPAKTYAHGNPLVITQEHSAITYACEQSHHNSFTIDSEENPYTLTGTERNAREPGCFPRRWSEVSFTASRHTKEEREEQRETRRPILGANGRWYESMKDEEEGRELQNPIDWWPQVWETKKFQYARI